MKVEFLTITIISVIILITIVSVLLEILKSGQRVSTAVTCDSWRSLVIDNDTVVYKNGSLLVNGILYENYQTFYDKTPENETERRACICQKKICIPKCCVPGMSWSGEKCTANSAELSMELMKLYDENFESLNDVKEISDFEPEDYYIIYHPIKKTCISQDILDYTYRKSAGFYVLRNGSLINYTERNGTKTMNVKKEIDSYCVEWHQPERRLIAFGCKTTKTAHHYNQIHSPRIMVGMIISIPFLVATFAVYCLLPELQNIVGKSLMSQVASLTLSYLAFIFNQVKPSFVYDRLEKKLTCSIIGYISHFSILANFFWLNVMCFDIWLVFSGFSVPYRSLNKNEEILKFTKHSLYAWGVPFIDCVLIFIADRYLASQSAYYCLMKGKNYMLYFYNFPILIVLISNAAMFSATAYNIYIHKKQNKKILNSEDSYNNRMEKERLNLYFKLFLVMGITWLPEPVSLAFDNKPKWFWIIFDQLNSLNGVTIFLIFICNQRVLSGLNKSLCPTLRIFDSVRESSVTSPTTSTTSASISSQKKKVPVSDEIEMARADKLK